MTAQVARGWAMGHGMDAPYVYVFGYGSLLWKTNFPYEEKVVGCVKGFVRRFWQGSVIHRGTPDAPGRVVTLVPKQEECTWGIAYKVQPKDVPDVMAYLNQRETLSYATHNVNFYPRDREMLPFTALVYIGTETHPNYFGPAPITALAEQIMNSRGHSGCNTDYVLQLARVMREIAPGVQDEHLFDLESKLKEMILEMLRKGDTISEPSRVCSDEDCMCKYCTEEILLQRPVMTEVSELEKDEMG